MSRTRDALHQLVDRLPSPGPCRCSPTFIRAGAVRVPLRNRRLPAV